jgi:hypothetical protein
LDLDHPDHRIQAVWYGPQTVVVLHGRMTATRHNAHCCCLPDSLTVTILDKNGAGALASYVLVTGSWDMPAAIRRFLVDGTLTVSIDANKSFATAGVGQRRRRIDGTRGSRAATIRVDPRGGISVVTRRPWTASVGVRGDIWGVHGSWRRPRLLALGPDGTTMFDQALPRGVDVSSVAVHEGGACVAVTEQHAQIACFDGDGRVRWRRQLPDDAGTAFVVDDAGWVFVPTLDGVLAIDPRGALAWRWAGRRPDPETMMLTDDELCFFSTSQAQPPRVPGARFRGPATELVCLPRRRPSGS